MVTKFQLISNVLTMKKYAKIGIISGLGLGIIYYYLTMSMLPTHFDAAVQLAPHYILTSIGLTIVISTLGGINFAMMVYKMNQIKKMNSVKVNSVKQFNGNIWWSICSLYSRMSSLYCTISHNFRSSWRIIAISNARIRIKIYFSRGIDFFNLLDCQRITK